MRPALDDVRIVALEQYGAGPWGTLHLANLGADVIKIEDPRTGGDVGRYVPPYQEGEDSLFFETFTAASSCVSLDLRHPAGARCSRTWSGRRTPCTPTCGATGRRKLRITYDDLKHLKPEIVCCSLSGFGMTGPRAAEGGYDYVLQGMAGWMSLTGEPDGPPMKSGLSLVDLAGGYAPALGMLAALWRARRDGTGCDVDVSLFETALEPRHVRQTTWPFARVRADPHEELRAPVGGAVPELPDRRRLDRDRLREAEVLRVLARGARPAWMIADPRFATMAARLEHREACVDTLQERLLERTTLGGAAESRPACRAGRSTRGRGVRDAQTVARDLVVAHEHPVLGTVRQIRSPLRMDDPLPEVGARRSAASTPARCSWSAAATRTRGVDELAAEGVFGDVEV